ncbi:uncharacterized protein LOC128988606 isoform X1 [Macrosteles quadrilineatus]|uniref:uncharacterized protein LOC128988606 isoform X1 n=1 Tax=Macrosteles quadrilineatus TaxID=74068 RepID=UPI0023E1A4E4|nr:uncharacterized protein LOC128988606 isoform X1 [Macrosteles quadrilineatus]
MIIRTVRVFLALITFCLICETSSDAPVMYLGCYEDGGPNNRLMSDHHQDFPGTLTPDMCNEHCRGKGFSYAGTQYSFECFCSKTKPSDEKKELESDCNSKCAGDDSKTCGGNNRLAVFTTGFPDPTESGVDVLLSLGCFKDSHANRFLSGHRQDFPGALTNIKCVKLCKNKGFHYAGTEYGKECHCGNRKPSYREYASDEECSKRCEGDINQLCGGNWRLSIFKTSNTDKEDPPSNGKYVGCYQDDENSRQLDGHLEDSGFLTHLKCTGLCYSRGFLYAGTQYSYQCFCGDKPPNPNLKLAEKECFKRCTGDPGEICGGPTRNSIRETGIPDLPVAGKYLGCFNDINNQIFGHSHKYTFDKTNTPRRCMNFCLQLGFRYSGVEYGKECFCGNEKPNTNLAVNQEDCSKPCSGDAVESCGADWRLAVYATNTTVTVDPIQPTTKRPCIPSETIVPDKSSICRGDVVFEEDFNTHLGNTWSHVIMIPDSPQENLEPQIDIRIPTNKRKRFSDFNKDNPILTTEETVEVLGVFVDRVEPKDVNSIFGESIASRMNKLSVTHQVTARSKISKTIDDLEKEEAGDSKENTCFEFPDSETVTPSSSATGEEFEFAVFTSDPANSFTTRNRLEIKPTFYDDEFVQSGTLNLNGCTGRVGSRQCELKASSYNIIPPVKSARIHTRDSFSFRYGIVEIRAKLPLGDWLVPELWLEPRNHFYGPGYTSGRIRIAMHRGNSDFKCRGEDFGSHRLESGVMMGSQNVQKRSLTTKLPENWHDHFHNYTLVWSPDSISFKIDNEDAQELLPAGRRLCEVIGFKTDECLTWSAGSRIAPFDKDFYISLGLSVGNARDFPDDCTNKGWPKPWKNTDPKAMLKLWQDRENWKATWTEENSSLIIDHIRVTAI